MLIFLLYQVLMSITMLQWHEKTGLWAVTAMRWSFDKITGYPNKMTEKRWLQRIVFLETVAGALYPQYLTQSAEH